MNYISVCSGIEAASVAWHPLGWNCLGVSEIEPFPSAVLAHHYPSVPNFGDMTKFKEWKLNGTVDLFVGGTPCQSFSVAGLRQGLKDPRGNLMLTFLAIAEHLKPKWILWENVPGVLSSNGGKDFGSFLGGLGELGYGFAYRVLDAQWCRTHRHPRAVPQRRRRVFVVGCAGDHISAAKVLFERESLQRYSAPRRATREGIATNAEESVGGGGKIVADVATVDARNNFDRGDSQHLDRLIPCWWDGDNTASTLTKSNANGAQRMPDKDNFGAVLQPVAIPIMPQAMQAEGWRVGKENQDGRGNGLGVGKDGDPCPTLDRSAVPAVAIQGTIIGRQDHNGPHGSGCSDKGEMFTLNSTDVYAVAVAPISMRESGQGFWVKDDIAGTLRAEGENRPSRPSNVISQTMQVRRLTPTECERLQGFPDGWTAIPWKKKPADQCPDGPRYKALGNSMAVNCMEWLGERIQAVESGTL
jgi:DNA (cytosine-5)-methyltransferase 1